MRKRIKFRGIPTFFIPGNFGWGTAKGVIEKNLLQLLIVH